MAPDVSIVLVTYNRASFLPRTLDCLLAQTYTNFELLVCDDCSSDDTQSICSKYAQRDPRIHYIKQPVNLGMPGNLNSGLKLANCEFIANLHDGDIYHPTLIEKWRAALLEYPNAGFVFNIYRHLSSDWTTGFRTNTFKPLIPGDEFLATCFADREMECPVWGTVMGRRTIYQSLGFFDSQYSFWSAFDMWFRIAETHDVAFVPEVLIELPSRTVMPHLFSISALATHRTIFQIYWAARLRHFKGHPIRLTAQLSKHIFDFCFSKTRRVLRRSLSTLDWSKAKNLPSSIPSVAQNSLLPSLPPLSSDALSFSNSLLALSGVGQKAPALTDSGETSPDEVSESANSGAAKERAVPQRPA